MKGINVLGYLGGTIIASSMPLQVYQCYCNGSTSDISWKWILGYLCGILLLFSYAQLENIPPVWGPLCLEITSTVLLISLKIKFDVIDHRVYTTDSSTQTTENGEEEDELTKHSEGKIIVDEGLTKRKHQKDGNGAGRQLEYLSIGEGESEGRERKESDVENLV